MARTLSTKTSKGNGRDTAAALRAAASALLDRYSFANRFGLGFSTSATATSGYDRDMTWALGYLDKLAVSDYRARYERGGIAERIVEAYPRATWSGGAALVEDQDPNTSTPFEEAAVALFDRLDLWSRLLRADILSGLGQYAAILIGADGDLSTELPSLSSEGAVLYVTTLAEDRAAIDRLVEDSSDPRYGLPDAYKLTLAARDVRVAHWTRVVHVAEGMLEDDLYGKPRLRAVWNYLDDLMKIVGGGAEAAWKRMDPGMQLDLDPEVELDAEAETALSDEVDEYLHGLRRVMRTRGVKLNMLTASVMGFGPNAESVLQLISATTGIPHRILTGSERGQLASTQDRNNWNDRIAERRREFAEPLVRDLVDRLIEHGALPEPVEYRVQWPESDELDETEKAAMIGQLASANKAQFEAEGTVILTANEIRDTILKLDPIEELEPTSEEEIEPEPAEEETLRAARDEPEWVAVHRAADANIGKVAAAFQRAWTAGEEGVSLTALEASLAQGNRDGAVRNVRNAVDVAESRLAAELPDILLAVLVDGAEATIGVAQRRGSWFRAAQVEMTFDATDPRAIAWAEREAALLVREVGEETIAAVRAMVVSGLEQGIPPRALARQIRTQVGLLTRQSNAVLRLREQLRLAEPGTLVTRFPPAPTLRRRPGFMVRIPPGGLSAAEIERRAARYGQMHRNLRARTIARTETLRAANEGQRQAWVQAQDKGLLQPDAMRVWIATLDSATRPEHAQRHGAVTGVNQPWPWGTEPGQEPNCRCSQGIATDKDLERARRRGGEPTIREVTQSVYTLTEGRTPDQIRARTPMELRPKATVAEIEAVENSIKGLRREVLWIFDEQGNAMVTLGGGTDFVKLPQDIMAAMRGSTWTHNHPRGTSFSLADINLAIRTRSASCRAMGARDVNGWGGYRYVAEFDLDALARSLGQAKADMVMKGIAPADAPLPHVLNELYSEAFKRYNGNSHEIWQSLSARLDGFTYNRTKW